MKQTGMDRREFLECVAGGLLLSVLTTRTSLGATAEVATFTSDCLTLQVEVARGGDAVLHSLRNPKTNFEWARTRASMVPVLTTAGQVVRDWTVLRSAQEAAAVGNRFEYTSRSNAVDVTTSAILQGFSDAPVVEFQSEFQNTGKTLLKAVTAYGPFRFALRDDIGPLRMHAVRRDTYALETKTVNGDFTFSGGRWKLRSIAGCYFWKRTAKMNSLSSELSGSAAGNSESRKTQKARCQRGSRGPDPRYGSRRETFRSASIFVGPWRSRASFPHRASLHATACLPREPLAELAMGGLRLLGDGWRGSTGCPTARSGFRGPN